MNSSVRVPSMGDTLPAKSVTAKVIHSPLWWGQVPAAVCLDLRISAESVRVFVVLSLSARKSRIVSVGMRQLADSVGCSAMTAKRRINELVKAGHLEVVKVKRGQRARYSLTSPVFDKRQGTTATEPVVAKPRKEQRKLAACRSCARLTVKLSKDALCRPCVNAAELERRVREARAQLGADATPEQISAHLKTADATSQVRRTLRSIREVA